LSNGCQTGLTTGWMFVYTIQPLVQLHGCTIEQPVVKPVWQPVWQQVVSCKRGYKLHSVVHGYGRRLLDAAGYTTNTDINRTCSGLFSAFSGPGICNSSSPNLSVTTFCRWTLLNGNWKRTTTKHHLATLWSFYDFVTVMLVSRLSSFLAYLLHFLDHDVVNCHESQYREIEMN